MYISFFFMNLYVLAFLNFLITFFLLSCIKHINFFNKYLVTSDEFTYGYDGYKKKNISKQLAELEFFFIYPLFYQF